MIEPFGVLSNGQRVERIQIKGHGLAACVLTWGAVLQDLRFDAFPHALVLGFDDFEHYPTRSPNFGSIVGRVANRIRNAKADIAGQTYKFDRNALERHTLHGGADGAGKQIWQLGDVCENSVSLTLRLADGHMGFPGNLDVMATYTITPGPTLEVRIKASSDAPTICNFAHHSYFNLDGGGDARNQTLQVFADSYLPTDADCIPTGKAASVEETPFDFRREKSIAGAGHSFDHNWCLSRDRRDCVPVAVLRAANCDLGMTIATTEPGLQVYDGAKIKTQDLPGLDGKSYSAFSGIAIEPQAWPDAPNQDWRSQTELVPGRSYEQLSRFSFITGAS